MFAADKAERSARISSNKEEEKYNFQVRGKCRQIIERLCLRLSHAWSKSSPRGEELPVSRACLPCGLQGRISQFEKQWLIGLCTIKRVKMEVCIAKYCRRCSCEARMRVPIDECYRKCLKVKIER